MQYYEYRNTVQSVWSLFLDMGVAELPVKISELLKRIGLPIYPYGGNEQWITDLGLNTLSATSDGFTFLKDGKHYIFYDDTKPPQRIRFTLAHELGHIVCQHEFDITEYGLSVTTRNREPSHNDNTREQQANVFASRLLAPACVLHELKLWTAEEIAKACDISLQSAAFRCERMVLLEQRNAEFLAKTGRGCFYLDPLERKVYEQFKPYIDSRL